MPEISSANVSDSNIAQLKHHMPVCEANVIVPEITVLASPSLCEDDRKTDEFLDLVQKKSVSDRIRQRNKEKKIQRESVNQDVTSEPVYVAETDSDDQNIVKSIKGNQLDRNVSSRKDSSRDDDSTVPSEQEVERDLMQQLSVPSISMDTEIPLTPPVIDKKQQFSVTAESIVYMFQKAVHSCYEEIFHWYGFAESYDRRINEIHTINKIKINTVKQQVYQEVKKLLPDISDANLRQQLSRARKLYKLFNAVDVKKIKQVTYSANAISSLNNTQNQNIIDYVLSKAITGDHQNPKNNQINALDVLDSAKASISTAPIPITQVSNSSGDSKGIGPEDLPKSQVSVPFTTSSGQVISSNKSRPPLLILPDDPEKKRKHVIGLVLEQFPYLSFRGTVAVISIRPLIISKVKS
jgi:hypothetical protein